MQYATVQVKMENNIVNWITGRSDLKQVPLEELKVIVQQYPYFTLAQLLLTVKMKKDNNPDYTQQLQKTALNFQNPQWLHFQLESLENELNKQEISDTKNNNSTSSEITDHSENLSASIISENEAVDVEEEDIQFDKEPQSIADLLKENEVVISHDPIKEDEAETLVEVNNEENYSSFPNTEPDNAEKQEADVLNDTSSENISNPESSEPEIIETESLAEEQQEIITPIESEISSETVTQEDESIASQATTEIDTSIEEASITDNNYSEEDKEAQELQPEKIIDEPLNQTQEEDEIIANRLSSLLEAQVQSFKADNVSKEELTFDTPVSLLPTKDYFASIGIATEISGNTDFGQKVKRFSDWLKQMKKIDQSLAMAPTSVNDEKIISQKAHDSNKPSTIVTETMVDILVQQHKNLEAIDTLEKLSLLKPEKSAYFASLIENLKNNI